MDWLQAFMIAGSTIGACFYMHRESLRWWQESRAEHDKEMAERANEMKEFHGRLCTLEERYLQMMQRMLEK